MKKAQKHSVSHIRAQLPQQTPTVLLCGKQMLRQLLNCCFSELKWFPYERVGNPFHFPKQDAFSFDNIVNLHSFRHSMGLIY